MDDKTNIHVYNAETRELAYELELKARATSVSISEDSQFLLLNRRDGEAQLVELATKKFHQKFLGHTGGEYLIRASFGGANESFVVSGSEGTLIQMLHRSRGGRVWKY
jgi:WD repeat-containing protein 26